MRSPFPGMDPYLESPVFWSDFHLTLIVALRAELNRRLPPRYAAAADRYVWLHEPDARSRTRLGKPDVFVTQQPGHSRTPVGLTAPATVILPAVRREGNKYLKILDVQSRRVVTVIEILSPSNKNPGEDRDAYLSKRIDYLSAGVNLVEMDLLRAGERLPLGEPTPPPADYYILVCRAWQMPEGGVWPITVRESLPTIPVPLLPGDEDTPLPLQPCVDTAYEQGRYDREINYNEPPEPPLTEPAAAWARELLAHRSH